MRVNCVKLILGTWPTNHIKSTLLEQTSVKKNCLFMRLVVVTAECKTAVTQIQERSFKIQKYEIILHFGPMHMF